MRMSFKPGCSSCILSGQQSKCKGHCSACLSQFGRCQQRQVGLQNLVCWMHFGCMALQVLQAVLEKVEGARLIQISGGDKRNAIARECSAIITVSSDG